jgi:hypothetical protein
MDEEKRDGEILDQLEEGLIDVDEAIRRLSDVEKVPPKPEAEKPESPHRWHAWWLIPFSIGIGITVAGAGVSTLGGWWWLCAGPLLLLGILLFTMAAAARESPWVHVRVNTGQDSWPRRIAISVPLPIRFTAWVLRVLTPKIKGLDATGIDELLVALDEGLLNGTPIFVEVDEGEGGEKIQVYLG